MFISEKTFNFIEKTKGITKDGDKYISVSVIDSDDNSKYSFYSKDDDVISSLSKLQISRFADITLIISFEKVFNPKTRFSNWQPLLVGVK